jgi:cell wall-associated NlpC family hydrolase
VLPDAKQECAPTACLSLEAPVAVADAGGRFARLEGGGYVFAGHLRPVAAVEADWVEVASRLLGLPYLWGGRGAGGIDCSGLVQVALAACGIACLRDSDQQAASIGEPVALEPDAWQRGDLIYVKGHVVIDTGEGSVVHATGHAWSVIEEKREQCLARLAGLGRPVTAVRRPRRA